MGRKINIINQEKTMKRLLMLTVLMALLLALLSPVSLSAEENDDVIEGWIHVTIKNLKTDKVMTDIRVPLALLEWGMQMEASKQLDLKLGKKCNFDWKKLSSILSKSKHKFLVEVRSIEDNKYIKVWIE